MKTLGKKISEYRKLHGLTQEELAIKLNVTAQSVSKWENDLSIPDLPILIELSELFHVSLDELVKQKESSVPVVVAEPLRKPVEQMLLKIKVLSCEGDKVNVNLPLGFVKACMQMGISMPQVGVDQDVMKNIDFDALMKMIDYGVVGKLVEVESADGDHVEIYVE